MISAGKSVGPTDAQIRKFVAAQVQAGADDTTIKAELAKKFPEIAKSPDTYDGKMANMIAAAKQKYAPPDAVRPHAILGRKMGSISPVEQYLGALQPYISSWKSNLRDFTNESGVVSGGPSGSITFTIQVAADGSVKKTPKFAIEGDSPLLRQAAEKVAAQMAKAQLPRPPEGKAIVLEIPFTIKG